VTETQVPLKDFNGEHSQEDQHSQVREARSFAPRTCTKLRDKIAGFSVVSRAPDKTLARVRKPPGFCTSMLK